MVAARVLPLLTDPTPEQVAACVEAVVSGWKALETTRFPRLNPTPGDAESLRRAEALHAILAEWVEGAEAVLAWVEARPGVIGQELYARLKFAAFGGRCSVRETPTQALARRAAPRDRSGDVPLETLMRELRAARSDDRRAEDAA